MKEERNLRVKEERMVTKNFYVWGRGIKGNSEGRK